MTQHRHQHSGPEGQQQRQHGEQADWQWPRRGDWMARLDEVLQQDARLQTQPAVLVAHSLGCQFGANAVRG
ncbi:hypothetical protein FKK32_29435, partial [Klebsiella pneumoniae]|nr:hypothetical protein [Klebsiella pneumoniae]